MKLTTVWPLHQNPKIAQMRDDAERDCWSSRFKLKTPLWPQALLAAKCAHSHYFTFHSRPHPAHALEQGGVLGGAEGPVRLQGEGGAAPGGEAEGSAAVGARERGLQKEELLVKHYGCLFDPFCVKLGDS